MRENISGTKGEKTSRLTDGVSVARITPPIAVPHFVFRQELVNRINKPAPHATFIVAPSGYGKTSLAVQLISQCEDPAIWYSVDKNDTTKDTAINIITAARRVIPNFAKWSEEYLQTDFNVIDWVIRLCNEFSQQPKDITIVWDGADLWNKDHLGMIQAFIDNSPRNLRFISLRKVMPEASFARLASYDALTFIGAADLKFGEEETRYVATRNGLNYDNPEIKKTLDSAQGWPAGIQLLAKEMAQSSGLNSPILFDGRTIVKSAVDNLPENDRKFLESLIFLDAITDSDALEITGEIDARLRLDRMSQEGLFITKVADDSPIYRLNTLIREVLQSNLSENTKLYKERALKSAELSIRAGNELHALEIYSLLGDEERAKEIAVKNIQKMMIQGNARLLRKWAPKLGENLGVPELGSKVLALYAELSIGAIEKAQIILTEIESDPELRAYASKYGREIQLAKARIAFSQGHFDKAIAGLEDLAEQGIFDGIGQVTRRVSGFRPAMMSAFIMGDRKTFLRFFDEAMTLAVPDDKYVQKITLPSLRAMESFLDGRYIEAHESAQLALHSAEAFGVKGIFIPFESAFVLADVSLEFGEEEKSFAVIDKYLPMAIEAQQWPWVVGLLAKGSLIRVQQGRVNEGLNLIRQAREYVSGPRFGENITYLADGHEIFSRVALNDWERIVELIHRLPQNEDTKLFLIGMEARKNPTEAVKILNQLPEGTDHQKFRKAGFLAMTTVNNPPVAMKYLQTALDLAVRNGYFRAFLNMPAEVKSLVLDLAVKNPTVYMEHLAKSIRAQSQIAVNDGGAGDNPLTKRELDILRRLSTGLPITQIAASLHISNNTIKTHLKNVYRKMDVASREEAVARGKELLLL